MKKCFFIISLLSIRFLIGQNIAPNPGFENGLNNWATYNTNTTYCTTQLGNSVSHGGTNSFKVTVNNAPSNVTGLVAQYLQVNPNGRYLFECFVKTNALSGAALPYIQLDQNNARLFGDGGLTTNQTSNWTKVSFRFYPPAGCDTIQLLLALTGTNGTAWFDDISLTELQDTSYTNFSVAVNSPTGQTIQPFMGVNVGPIDPTVSTAINLTPGFIDLGIEYVRTHDFEGPCDMHVVFPDTSKNPLDSTAYDFALTDSVIKAIVACSAKVYFRLGESGTTNTNLYNPPGNYDKWAQVCLQIVKHYNSGWNNGYHYNIKYWEVYNEPDTGPGVLWNGSVQDYIKLYRHTAVKLKQYDNTLKVGGPTVSSIFSSDFVNEFLDSVATHGLPLDFFSYHFYHSFNPYNFAVVDKIAQQTLTLHGLGNTERIVSEWSNLNFSYSNIYFIWRDDPFMAASTAASLSYYQNTGVGKLLRYRADQTDLGMFYNAGNYNFTGLAYKLFSTFRGAPQQLAVSGYDSLGTSILAGATLLNDAVAVLVANNDAGANGYNLSFTGINPGDQYIYHTYRLDSIHYIYPVDSGIVASLQNTITVNVHPPFADLLILNKINTNAIQSDLHGAQVAVYPNPFIQQTTIYWKGVIAERIEITDIAGRVVKTFSADELKSNSVEWNAGEMKLKPGLYLVRFYEKNTSRVLKVVLTE